MRVTVDYRLSETDKARGRSQLLRADASIAEVDGVVLEAQFELPDGTGLVWLADDSPYDEGLHIYLLSADGRILDALESTGVFSPGVLKIQATGETWVAFTFYLSDPVQRLEIVATAGWRRLPGGWRYKKLGRHRLSLHAQQEGAR